MKAFGSRSVLFCILVTVAFNPAFTQPVNRQIVNQPVQWTAISSNLKIKSGIQVFLDGQLRWALPSSSTAGIEPMQHQFRTHLDFQITKNLWLAPVGFVQVWNYSYGKQPASIINNEHRIYQQITYSHGLGKVRLNHRFRTEERFIQDHDGSGSDLGFINRQVRARYRVMANLPLKGPKIEPGGFFASAYYEGFTSRGKHVTFHEIDQNRTYLGLGYQFTPEMNINAGLFYQMLIKSNGAKQENNIGIMVMLTKNIDLTKKP